MRLTELVSALRLLVLTPQVSLDQEVRGVYCGDLLSDVLASARPGDIWVTIQRHINTVAVAKVAGIPAILVCKGIKPNKEVIDKATEDGIAILSAQEPVFAVAGQLYWLLFGEKDRLHVGGEKGEHHPDQKSEL